MIVIPMAGLSKRFADAGYKKSKYMLIVGGQSVFAHVMKSFEAYFASEYFLFICRDEPGTISFVADECRRLNIENGRLVTLKEPTRGQAETVALGLEQAEVGLGLPITIFNIDTIRPHFRFPPSDVLAGLDGYMEVFKGQGDHWSFALTKSQDDMSVLQTAEKKRISDLCSTGLYDFRRAGDFLSAYEEESKKPKEELQGQELYIAPLYNHLILRGRKILAVEIPPEHMIPCGTPDDFESFKQKIEKTS